MLLDLDIALAFGGGRVAHPISHADQRGRLQVIEGAHVQIGEHRELDPVEAIRIGR